jgi:hypothetical protein
VSLQRDIADVFEHRAFMRPLFYSHPGGLRFALSEAGTSIEQFLLAMQKARAICEDIFTEEGSLVSCLRLRSEGSPFGHRPLLAELRDAGICIPSSRCQWGEAVPRQEWLDENHPEWWINVAFKAPLSLLPNLLWCALATDLGVIRPRPHCSIYLFNLDRRVMVFPYDDRGMDVVGPNHRLLADLFQKHRQHLLEYDLATMRETFEAS